SVTTEQLNSRLTELHNQNLCLVSLMHGMDKRSWVNTSQQALEARSRLLQPKTSVTPWLMYCLHILKSKKSQLLPKTSQEARPRSLKMDLKLLDRRVRPNQNPQWSMTTF